MNFKGETDHPMHSCWLSLFDECAESLLYLVTETVATGRRHHLTEKTFKPIAMGMPFVIVGTKGSLEYLRSYGFRTFEGIWDESYDSAEDDVRIARIASLLRSLNELSPGDKQHLFDQARKVIEHNWNHFYNGGFEKILWKELQEINNITNTDSLNVGQVIKIPDNSVSRNATVSKQPAVSPKNNATVPFSGDPLEALKIEISKGEGGYNSYNRGVAGDSTNAVLDITQMTINEIMTKQSTKFSNGKRELFAVGRYQMIPVTLAEAVKNKRLGVSPTDLFSPETQEKLFMHLIYKRPYLIGYLTGKSSDIDAAVNDLAREFASLPMTNGKGRYDGDKAGNKASGGLDRVEKIKSILIALRDSGFIKK
jgi:muramidase (phage lysozyme)